MAEDRQANVDIAGMRAALPRFETALGDTTSAYRAMSEQAQVLVATWTGDAAQAFIPALNQWLDDCNTVRQQLQLVFEKLEAGTSHDAATAERPVA